MPVGVFAKLIFLVSNFFNHNFLKYYLKYIGLYNK